MISKLQQLVSPGLKELMRLGPTFFLFLADPLTLGPSNPHRRWQEKPGFSSPVPLCSKWDEVTTSSPLTSPKPHPAHRNMGLGGLQGRGSYQKSSSRTQCLGEGVSSTRLGSWPGSWGPQSWGGVWPHRPEVGWAWPDVGTVAWWVTRPWALLSMTGALGVTSPGIQRRSFS